MIRLRQDALVAHESWSLEAAEAALVAVLLLRGPQTVAELRSRTERVHTFESLAEVESTLRELAAGGRVQLLERHPGQKEARWQQLLAEEAEQPAPAAAFSGGSGSSSASAGMADRVAQLEARVARLEAALGDL